ncbi:hypothetical protein [Propionibacterium australiense]|uniref:Uncharacterized protein n=1 Tax=Propionibacterium australiense TaxID=119981 RepID=A0A8B3FN45_9ACTN|nr:hypothetical protein [Propionibacterium australiense]RLP11106.1 hypothetical protein D7U36_04855 [Propionibacterium australiense]
MPNPVIECLRLVSLLNAMGVGALDAPLAEHALRTGEAGETDRPHHVADPESVLGLDAGGAVPVRLALARIADRMRGALWMLVLARPGNLGGLRGPAAVNEQALACGAAVVNHDGGVTWFPHPIGPAMQWQLARAERPLPPPTPGEAATALNEQILESARELAALDATAGQRPADAASVVLGRAYPARNQQLLDKAMLWREACAAGLDAGDALLHSHAQLTRSTHLRRLDAVCCEAISAAASWPDMSPART